MTEVRRHIAHNEHDPTDVRGLSVTVVGCARSGLAVARLLNEHKADVFVTEYGPISEQDQALLEEAGINYEQNGHSDRADAAEFMVTSPGVPDSAPILDRAVRNGTPIYSEIEVATWFCDAPIVAVTGSNGKTTTTALIGHIFKNAGRQTHIVGNIGRPFSDVADQASASDVVVLEVSSFQLDHISSFRPAVSVLLNITPDHMDRYQNDMSLYAESKFRILENQCPEDAFIYNMDDERIVARLDGRDTSSGPVLHGYTLSERPTASGFITQNKLIIQTGANQEVLMQLDELALKGRHNAGNSLAAAIAARVMEVGSDTVRSSLSSFEGVPHRLEFVREVDGVRYVNDSKATNVNAVWFALESMNQPVVLIAGGRDKGNDYESIKELASEKVRILVAIGESAATVQDELGPHVDQTVLADSMADAVSYASLLARSGETVVLSPACASFDMFDNYEARGDIFKQIVSDL